MAILTVACGRHPRDRRLESRLYAVDLSGSRRAG